MDSFLPTMDDLEVIKVVAYDAMMWYAGLLKLVWQRYGVKALVYFKSIKLRDDTKFALLGGLGLGSVMITL